MRGRESRGGRRRVHRRRQQPRGRASAKWLSGLHQQLDRWRSRGNIANRIAKRRMQNRASLARNQRKRERKDSENNCKCSSYTERNKQNHPESVDRNQRNQRSPTIPPLNQSVKQLQTRIVSPNYGLDIATVFGFGLFWTVLREILG